MPTASVLRRISRLSRSWIVGPDLAPDLLGDGGEPEHVRAVLLQVRNNFGQLLGQRLKDPVVLGDNGIGVGLVIDGMQQGSHPRPAGLGRDGPRTPSFD